MLIGGIGLALSFVPMTIAGLTGVSRADAGIASGLINTSRQVGGAVGLAAVSTIVTSYAQSGSAGGRERRPHAGLPGGLPGALRHRARRARRSPAIMLAPRPEPAERRELSQPTTDPLEEAA